MKLFIKILSATLIVAIAIMLALLVKEYLFPKVIITKEPIDPNSEINDLGMVLPTMSGTGDITIDSISLEILPGNQVKFGENDIVSMAEAKQRLEKFQSSSNPGDQLFVTIAAHDDSRSSDFVELLDILAEVGIENVTISGFSE